MAHPKKKGSKGHRKKKKGGSKKCRAVVTREQPVGEMETVYRAVMAWVRRLAAALRRAVTRAGGMVASDAALAKNDCASTSPPPTDAAPSPTGDTNLASGSHAGGSESSPDSISYDSSASTDATDSGSEDSGSASAPASESCDSSAPTRPKNSASQGSGSASAPASKSCDSSAPTSAKNSVSRASGSASAPASKSCDSSAPTRPKNSGSGPASKACDSAWHLVSNRATLSRPTGAKTTRRAGKARVARNRGVNQEEPSSDGYHLTSLFKEEECFVEEEDALIYARFCSKRAISLLDKNEICHICYFLYGKVFPCRKEELEKHCRKVHSAKCGFLCEKQGCLIRTSSLKERGRHHLFCHEKPRDWWVKCLKLHGEM